MRRSLHRTLCAGRPANALGPGSRTTGRHFASSAGTFRGTTLHKAWRHGSGVSFAAAIAALAYLTASPAIALDEQAVAQSKPPGTRFVDLEELAEHRTSDSAWVVLNGEVWDVTEFMLGHPGGAEVLLDHAGTDISALFKTLHAKGTFERVSPSLVKVGTIFAGSPIPAASSADAEGAAARRASLFSSDLIVNLSDFETQAKYVLGEHSGGWVYYNSWADDGRTFLSNRSAYSLLRLLPRVFVPVRTVDSSTEFLSSGLSVPLPIFMAPTGGSALAHPDGELNLTRASAKTQIPQCVSSVASKGILGVLEERDAIVEQGGPKAPIWFQLYIKSEREQCAHTLKQIARAGVDAILVTVDTAVFGNRESHLVDARRKALQNGTAGAKSLAREYSLASELQSSSEFEANLSWDDIAWIKTIVPDVPVLVKGISAVEDVALAKAHGASGVVLSNHGGRQLDFAPPPIASLVRLRREQPALLSDPEFEVYMDGGVTRGTDVLKAIALGAKGVGIGRTMLYAQACYGEEGVLRACEILAQEIHRGMRLLGATNLSELKPDMVEVLDGLVGMQER